MNSRVLARAEINNIGRSRIPEMGWGVRKTRLSVDVSLRKILPLSAGVARL